MSVLQQPTGSTRGREANNKCEVPTETIPALGGRTGTPVLTADCRSLPAPVEQRPSSRSAWTGAAGASSGPAGSNVELCNT